MKYQKLAYRLMQGEKKSIEEWAEEFKTQPRYIQKMVDRINRQTLINIYAHDGILDTDSIADKNLEVEGLERTIKILRRENTSLKSQQQKEEEKSFWKKAYERLRKKN